MGRPRKVKKLMPGQKPALRIEFSGKHQQVFFDLHKLGERVELTGTVFARRILIDAVALHKHYLTNGNEEKANQMLMRLTKTSKQPKEGAERKRA